MSDKFKSRRAKKSANKLTSTIGALFIGLGIFMEMYFVIPSIAWRPQQIPTTKEIIIATIASVIFSKLFISFCVRLLDSVDEDAQA